MTDLVQDDVITVEGGCRCLVEDAVGVVEFHPQATELIVVAVYAFHRLHQERTATICSDGVAELPQIEG
ncbi:hypothetical protein [Streptomyces sp. NPDC058991]|uniref:hypothetical protein n=1 Tax=unclassified Streptomyces TaxID=2593676 RepID=UPI00369F93A8